VLLTEAHHFRLGLIEHLGHRFFFELRSRTQHRSPSGNHLVQESSLCNHVTAAALFAGCWALAFVFVDIKESSFSATLGFTAVFIRPLSGTLALRLDAFHDAFAMATACGPVFTFGAREVACVSHPLGFASTCPRTVVGLWECTLTMT